MDYFPCRYGINSSWENSRISRRPLLSIDSISTLYVLPVNCLMPPGQPNPYYICGEMVTLEQICTMPTMIPMTQVSAVMRTLTFSL